MPDERLSPSPSSADVSLPSSALSTSGAAETITVGISEAARVDLLDCCWPMVDGGEAGGGLDRSLVSKAVGEPVERPRAAAKLSMDPSSDE